MIRLFFVLGSLSGALSVALGAFGAHALKDRLSSELMSIYETGVRYQMLHALALLATAWAGAHWTTSGLPQATGWLFVAGTLVFSGSLYLLSLTGWHWLGAITPIGGMAFIAGWCLLAVTAWRG